MKFLVKFCGVCGEVANGYNFNSSTMTCEPCKQFFRRNANNKQLKCWKQQNCALNRLNRRYCSSCRLQKCYAIGMENIWLTKSKLIENHIRKLTILEHQYMDEVQKAINVIPIEGSKMDQNGQQIFDLIHLCDQLGSYIKPYAQFCTQIGAFNSLPHSSQLKLLKNFYCNASVLHIAFEYNAEYDSLPASSKGNNINCVMLAKISVFQNRDFEQDLRKFATSINRLSVNDTTLRGLIMAYILFSKQEEEDLTNSEYIRYNHILYSRLLKRYLDLKFPKTQYFSLMNCLARLQPLSANFHKINLSLNSRQLSQELQEIFDFS